MVFSVAMSSSWPVGLFASFFALPSLSPYLFSSAIAVYYPSMFFRRRQPSPLSSSSPSFFPFCLSTLLLCLLFSTPSIPFTFPSCNAVDDHHPLHRHSPSPFPPATQPWVTISMTSDLLHSPFFSLFLQLHCRRSCGGVPFC